MSIFNTLMSLLSKFFFDQQLSYKHSALRVLKQVFRNTFLFFNLMHDKMSQFAENCTILSSNTKDLIYLNLMTISKILTINVSKVKIHELYLFLLYINIFDLIE
jgi:hypothetical protein